MPEILCGVLHVAQKLHHSIALYQILLYVFPIID